MKKLFLILFLLLNFSNISYSDDLGEIVKKLDKIDKRLSDIEEKMKFFDILTGLENENITLNDQNNVEPPLSKLKLGIGIINCKKNEIYGNDLYIAGYYENNFEKGVKMIDGVIEIKDLFGDTINRLSINKNTSIRTDKTTSFSGTYNIGSSEDCKKMNNKNIKDFKFSLDINKIAFEDNTVIEF